LSRRGISLDRSIPLRRRIPLGGRRVLSGRGILVRVARACACWGAIVLT
jgi:hypothetical protein